jgi:hypothetical protein
MNIRIRIFISLIATLVSYCGCASYAVSRPYLFGWHSEGEKEIGKQVALDLFYNKGGLWQMKRATTKANVTITKVTVSSKDEFYYLTVNIVYENLDRKKMEWEYGNAYLVDSEKNMYQGRDHFDFVDFFERPSRPFHFLEVEAGMSAQNFVVFKVPKSAFDNKLFFGFVSVIEPNNVQGKILVFDRSKSTYLFSQEKSFKSINWSE